MYVCVLEWLVENKFPNIALQPEFLRAIVRLTLIIYQARYLIVARQTRLWERARLPQRMSDSASFGLIEERWGPTILQIIDIGRIFVIL